MGISALDLLGPQSATSSSSTAPQGVSVLVAELISQDQAPRTPARSKSGTGSFNFRSLLDATTFGGLTQSATTPSDSASARASKVPGAAPTELSGTESSSLLEAAQAEPAESDTQTYTGQVYRAATSRYVQAFFADSSAFARPGDSLEVTA